MPKRIPRSQNETKRNSAAPPTISARWLATTVAAAFAAAAVCGWALLCFMFWQGSWQLLYHPAKAVTRTPASTGLAFDAVGFATTEAGEPRLRGWWIPAAPDARYTAIYLHSASGNLGDTVDALARLHAAGLNVLAFDYRGYGQSQFVRPGETHWREDAAWALEYLTGTRHVALNSIVVVGDALGASLALEVAAAHPGLGGVVLQEPDEEPLAAIFRDPRSRLVPAHALVRDRWDLNASAAELRIPSLWFYPGQERAMEGASNEPEIFRKVTAPKMLVRLSSTRDQQTDYLNALTRWLDNLTIASHPAK